MNGGQGEGEKKAEREADEVSSQSGQVAVAESSGSGGGETGFGGGFPESRFKFDAYGYSEGYSKNVPVDYQHADLEYAEKLEGEKHGWNAVEGHGLKMGSGWDFRGFQVRRFSANSHMIKLTRDKSSDPSVDEAMDGSSTEWMSGPGDESDSEMDWESLESCVAKLESYQQALLAQEEATGKQTGKLKV